MIRKRPLIFEWSLSFDLTQDVQHLLTHLDRPTVQAELIPLTGIGLRDNLDELFPSVKEHTHVDRSGERITGFLGVNSVEPHDRDVRSIGSGNRVADRIKVEPPELRLISQRRDRPAEIQDGNLCLAEPRGPIMMIDQ